MIRFHLKLLRKMTMNSRVIDSRLDEKESAHII